MVTDSEKPLRVNIVGHVDTNYPDAFRTRADYIEDQRRAQWLFGLQVVTLVVAIGSMAGTYLQVAAALSQPAAQVSCPQLPATPAQNTTQPAPHLSPPKQ